jgi:uncharacterized membrane protein
MTRNTTKDRQRDEQDDEELDREEFDEDNEPMDDGGSSGGVFAELKNVVSDAALSVLAPVAKQAATSAAKYAVKKAPDLLEDTVKPMLEDAGGPAGMLAKLKPGGDDDEGGSGNAGDGTGRGRRMPVQQAVDVAAPIDVVYDQWTQFEDYPKFMHRVQRVEQRDDSHVAFHAKVWGINRMWEAEIVEQRPDERIVFKSVNGVQLTGVVTFHDMAERLTHIELNIDVDPDGPVEKIARGARFVKRAARADLKRFKAFVEMREDETGAWRGEIQDGDVVSEQDEDREDDERDEEEYDDEPEASSEEEEEDRDEDEDEDDEEEQPRRRRRSSGTRKAKSSNGGDPKKKPSRAQSSRKSTSRSRSSNGRSSARSKSSSGRKSRSKAGGRK